MLSKWIVQNASVLILWIAILCAAYLLGGKTALAIGLICLGCVQALPDHSTRRR